jgi:hypothetical protein
MNNIPWSSVGYLTYKRTYARFLNGTEGPTEEFPDTVERVVDACRDQLHVGFTTEEEDRLRAYHYELKGLVAGRMLWQLGTKTVDNLGLASMQNCAGCLVDHPITPFTWTMRMLGLGSGVGFNIQRKYVNQLPPVKEWFEAPTEVEDYGADFIVPDSLEGWTRLLGKTLKAAFLSVKPDKGTFTYSTQAVRAKGKPIKGFGGTASGSEPLIYAIGEISKILKKRRGKKVRPIDCLDIMNLIAHVIVAGNVRRSALLAIGDPDDTEYLLAKNWDLGNIPPWRGMSNNSVACDDLKDLHEYFWLSYDNNSGENYGLINLALSRKCGRLGEDQYPDPDIVVYNPCAEQGLANFETCALATIFLPNITSKEELFDLVEILYKIVKKSLALPSHSENTGYIIDKNMRMGISMGGWFGATKEQMEWADEAYDYIREFDVAYSIANNYAPSIKLTTCKPDGTAALLPGTAPGAHPGYAEYMIRRITVAADHQLVGVCREAGYDVEYRLNIDGSIDHSSVIVSFPFKYASTTKSSKDVSAIEQLEMVRKVQTIWSDNSVSCTVYYRQEELPAIKEYLAKYYKSTIKTISFLRHSDHGFAQAPFEEISEERYNEMVARVKPVTSLNEVLELDTSSECAGDVCPMR